MRCACFALYFVFLYILRQKRTNIICYLLEHNVGTDVASVRPQDGVRERGTFQAFAEHTVSVVAASTESTK